MYVRCAPCMHNLDYGGMEIKPELDGACFVQENGILKFT